MSLEQLVIVLFVVIPLFEGLMRVLRARNTPQEGHSDKVLAQSSTPRATTQLPARQAEVNWQKVEDVTVDARKLSTTPPLLPPRRDPRERLARLVRRKRSGATERTSIVPVFKAAPRAHSRASAEVRRGIGPSRDLRSAIVLTTILGPCRALAPRDMPYDPA